MFMKLPNAISVFILHFFPNTSILKGTTDNNDEMLSILDTEYLFVLLFLYAAQ